MINRYKNFAPAMEHEATVYGACRPGYPSKMVSQTDVIEWINFMHTKKILRVVCLLPKTQLAYYEDLLGSYKKGFGDDKVCWVGITDYCLATLENLTDTILPFLVDAENHHEKTVVHCSAGCGRTGHVLAAWLVSRRGLSNKEAIDAVARNGRNAEESGDSRLFSLFDECRKKFSTVT